jgi:hypothetical protein
MIATWLWWWWWWWWWRWLCYKSKPIADYSEWCRVVLGIYSPFIHNRLQQTYLVAGPSSSSLAVWPVISRTSVLILFIDVIVLYSN